jgi:protein-L-isoaspartate(D-aspartate) O-methyltransferase
MKDTYRHKGLRVKLVKELENKGIKDQRVLEAINSVPRHLFMDSGFVNFAYKDQAFPIGAGQTISQPFTVAFQSELLKIQKFDKVLEVGTGSGYQAAVLVEMGAKVFTIERQYELFMQSQTLLPGLGYNAHFVYGDGYEGLPTYGPFDKIIVTAGADDIPEKLISQLKNGGRMVVPIGNRANQKMKLLIKHDQDEVEVKDYGNFVFVPMLKGRVR